ncbi:hypothetical protein DDD64_08745 [Actinotignum sanguinis]|nr:hypothetical protein DDD64_08745 [Actinotignum sanguinis]
MDESTGAITLTPGRTVNPSDYSVPVKVTYPDNTTAVIYATVTVTESDLIPGDFKLSLTRNFFPVREVVLAEGQALDPVVDITATQKLRAVDHIRFKTVCTKKKFDGTRETTYQETINGWEVKRPNYWPRGCVR